MKRFFVVDGHSQLFRAYHAVGYLSTSKGIPTQAVLILSTMLWKLIREEQPDYLAIAWDPSGPTFRDALSAEYKATRAAMPDDLARQLPYVRRLVEALVVHDESERSELIPYGDWKRDEAGRPDWVYVPSETAVKVDGLLAAAYTLRLASPTGFEPVFWP